MDPKTKPRLDDLAVLDVTLTQEIELPLDDEEDDVEPDYDDTLHIQEL